MIVVVASVLLTGSNSIRNGSLLIKSYQAQGLVNACVEEALVKIQQNNFFSGTGTLAFGLGNCFYNVDILAGENRSIMASSTVGTVVRKVRVSVDAINPKIHTSKWQEVAD